MHLTHQRDLSAKEAETYLGELEVPWNEFPLVSHVRDEPPVMMDVDPLVLYHPGARCFAGGKVESLARDQGPTLIVEGDLIVDGTFYNDKPTLIRGDLVARGVINLGAYLVVVGDLRCSGFAGFDENYGTYVTGDALLGTAALHYNHHMGVCGKLVADLAQDEIDGEEDVLELMETWGLTRETWEGERGMQELRAALDKLPMPGA